MRPALVPADRLGRLREHLAAVEGLIPELTGPETLEVVSGAARLGALGGGRFAALAALAAAPTAPAEPSAAASLLLDPLEAARLLGISKSTLLRRAAAGLLPIMRPSPGVVRFHRTDLEAFAVKCRDGGNTAEP